MTNEKTNSFYEYIMQPDDQEVTADEYMIERLKPRKGFDDYMEYVIWTIGVLGTLYIAAQWVYYITH